MTSCHDNLQIDVQVKYLFLYKSIKIDAEILCLHHKGICLLEMHFCSAGLRQKMKLCLSCLNLYLNHED